MRHSLSLSILVATGLLLSACGGGGTGGTTSPTTSNPPTPSEPEPEPVVNYDTQEYRRNYGLGTVDSIPAYEAGLSGDGITVGVVDTGIDLQHDDLDNNISPLSIDLDSNTYDGAQDEDGHGTWVAGIIAAEKNDTGTHGVAFDASVMAIRADDHEGCDDGCTFTNFDVADGIDYAVANGARVVNLSLGGDFTIRPDSSLGRALINAVNSGVVVVMAAGNGDEDDVGRPEPDGFASFATHPSVKGGIIIAGAVNELEDIAGFSNKAGTGETQDVYLVAPGVSIVTTTLESKAPLTGLARVSGTSAATPHIAAAAAILLEQFPNLTGRQVVEILLETAKDLGEEGADEIFGRGLVDIGAAIQPSGTLQISSAAGESLDLEGDLQASPAMGDGLGEAMGSALAFDRYNRAYNAALIDRFEAPARRFSLGQAAARLNRVSSNLAIRRYGLQLGISTEDRNRHHAATSLERQALNGDTRPDVRFNADITPRLSIAMQSGSTAGHAATTGDMALTARAIDPASQLSASGQRAEVTFALTPDLQIGSTAFVGERANTAGVDRTVEPPRQSGAALTLRRWISRTAHLDLEAGRMTETGSTLGLSGTGVFDGIDGAATDYLKLGAGLSLGTLRLDGAYMAGRTETELNGDSVFAGFSTLKSNGWSLTLTDRRFMARGHLLGLHVTQPMAVTSGTADLHLATGWADGAPVFSRRTADLSVQHRETSFEAFHRIQASDTLSLQTNFIYRRNPDNLAGVGDEAAVFLHLATAL